jgi:hypothetical protein
VKDIQLEWNVENTEDEMAPEIFYGIGALILLTALIFGVLQYYYRDRRAVKIGGEIARDRYERNET